MAQRRPVRRRKKTRRHWRIPPPPLRDGDAPGPEGLLILEEISDEFGVFLWKNLRAVLLWSLSDADRREELFDPEAATRRQAERISVTGGRDHPLDGALDTMIQLLSDPDGVDPEEIGVACSLVATWAEGEHFPATSLEFRQAAALSCPSNPRLALAMMRASRDQARYGRAEAWFHRTVGLARQCKDWDAYTRAYLAHGTMMRRRGALPAARRSYMKALRRSTRQGLSETRSMALHDLFVLESYSGDREAASRYARQAADAYGADHAKLPVLAHDVAMGWLEEGGFDEALPVLRSAFPLLPPGARAVAVGSIARAAGGVGEAEEYEWARRELTRTPPGPGVAEAWIEVARGAVLLGRTSEAKDAARRGEDLARERYEGQVRMMAWSLIECITAEEQAARALAESARTEGKELRVGLADHLVTLLEAGLAGSRKVAGRK